MRPLGILFYDLYVLSAYLILVSQILLVFYGIRKIYLSLLLIQEINANAKESEHYDSMRETFKLALAEYDQSKKAEVSIKFIDKSFPLNVNVSTELTISFRVKLEKGSVLNNVYVWFFIPDGFELIYPSEGESWRQAADYDRPNIRTVKIGIGTLSIGPYISGALKIKTPATADKYTIRYKIYGDGYTGSAQDVILFIS